MSDMVCMSGVDLLADYLEGVLPAATVAALDQHVAGCPRCQAFVASYRATPRILRDATDRDLPAELGSSLLAWLREHRGDKP
jgi:anti-sigma factor RsiW